MTGGRWVGLPDTVMTGPALGDPVDAARSIDFLLRQLRSDRPHLYVHPDGERMLRAGLVLLPADVVESLRAFVSPLVPRGELRAVDGDLHDPRARELAAVECWECMRHGTSGRGERQAGLAAYEAFRDTAPPETFDDDDRPTAREVTR